MRKIISFFAIAALAFACVARAASLQSWNDTNIFKSPLFNPASSLTNIFTASDSGTLAVGSGSVWTWDTNYVGGEDSDHVFVPGFLGAMTRTISRGTNLWALTGGTLAPSVAQTTLRATNIQSHDNLTAMGGFTFNLGTNIVMPPGSNTVPVANAISRYSYIWLTSDANTTDPTLRTAYLGVPTVRGGWLVVENYTNGIIAQSAFQMTNQAPLVGAMLPWQTLTLINGDWKPTRGGESLLLQTDGRGWREVARWWGAAGTVQTNLLAIINPTDLYHPYRQGSNQFADSYIVRLANEEYVTNASLRVAHQGTFNDDGGAGQTFTTYGQNKNSAFQVLDDYAQLEYNIQAIIGTNDPTATHGLSLYNYAMSDPSVAYEAENSLSLNWLGSAWSTNQALSHLTRWSAWGKGVAAAADPTTTWVLESQIAALAPTTNLTVDADSKTYAHLGSLAITRNDTDFAGFGITPGGNAFIQTTNGGNAIDLFNTTYANTISPHDDDTYSLGAVHSAGSWLYSLARTNLVKSYDEGISTTNYVWMGVSMNNKQAIFDIQSETNDVLGPVTGYSFRTNGVELFSITGTGGPSSGANWVASGTTNSTLAGTATVGGLTNNGTARQVYTETTDSTNRPVANQMYFTASPTSTPVGGTDWHGIDLTYFTSSGNVDSGKRLYPFESSAQYGGAAAFGDLVSMYSYNRNALAGSVVNAVGLRLACVNEGTGGITNVYYIKTEDPGNGGGGTIQNVYGVYLPAYTTGSVSNWGVYSANKNYLQSFITGGDGQVNGKLGINTATTVDLEVLNALAAIRISSANANGKSELQFANSAVPNICYHQISFGNNASLTRAYFKYGIQAETMTLGFGGADKHTFLSSGNLGLMTNNPSEVLEVLGNIKASGKALLKGGVQDGYTNVLTSATGKDVFYVSVPNTNGIGGHVVYTVFATDGTDVQEISGDVKFAAVAKSTTVTASTADVQAPAVVTGGSTLTAALAANVATNNTFALGITATTSLTTTNLILKWRLETPSTMTVVPIP